MSEESIAPPAIDFDRAQFDAASAPSMAKCAFCQRPLQGSYFDINGHPACEGCRYSIEQAHTRGAGTRGFLKALGAGILAAIAGFLLYWGIESLTGFEFGLIAIVVGYLVGRAVRWGSSARGGWVYQTMAVLLTYMAISCTYLPGLFKAWREEHPRATAQASPPTAGAPVTGVPDATPPETEAAKPPSVGRLLLGIGALLALAAALPFLAGAQNILGILILGFGVFEAWKLNRRAKLLITGPLTLRPPAASNAIQP